MLHRQIDLMERYHSNVNENIQETIVFKVWLLKVKIE